MKRSHAFRPYLSDILEDRLVLSHAVAHAAVVHEAVKEAPAKKAAAPKATVAPFQPADTQSVEIQLNSALASFSLDYTQAQSTYFSAVAADPTATNSSLQSFVAGRVSTLVQQLNQYIGALPDSNPTTTSYITGALAGTAQGTLQQQLQNITPVGTNGQTVPQYAQQAATIIQTATQTVDRSFVTFANLVNLDLYSQYVAQHTAVSTKKLTIAQRYKLEVQQAEDAAVARDFTNYINSVNSARLKTLFVAPATTALATTSTTSSTGLDLSGNTSAYNSQVANATNTLWYGLTAALGSQSGALSSLVPSIGKALFSPTNGLYNSLSTMQTPTDLTGLSAQNYTSTVFNDLNTAYQDVIGRVNTFNTTPTTNFTPDDIFGSGGFVPTAGSNGFFIPPTTSTLGSTTTSPSVTSLAESAETAYSDLQNNNAGYGLAGYNAFNGGFTLPTATNAYTNPSSLAFTPISSLLNGTGLTTTGTTTSTATIPATGIYGNGLRTITY